MTTITLDSIVRNILLKRKYPLHYYLEFILYAKEALREISMDDLHIYNTKTLPVDKSGNFATLPSDYLDYIGVYAASGQKLRPLVESDSITPLQAFDSNFNVTTYENKSTEDTILLYGNLFLAALWNTTTFNQYGEATGRFFGLGAGNPTDTFRVFKNRNQIQLNEGLGIDNVILCYISDGTSADAATHIDLYAQKTIDSYCMYLFKENNRTYGQGEAENARQIYIGERKILRARLSDLTANKIKRIIQKNSTGSIHN